MLKKLTQGVMARCLVVAVVGYGGAAQAATMLETIHGASGHWRGYEASGTRLDLELSESALAGVGATGSLMTTTVTGEETKLSLEIVEIDGSWFVLTEGQDKPALAVTRTPAGALSFQRLFQSGDGNDTLAVERIAIGKQRPDATRTLSWESSAKVCRAPDRSFVACGAGSSIDVVARSINY